MNTEYLKTFITLAETGSFSKTAKTHIVVQSTITNRIQELEREVGQRLFIRNHNHAELTLAGKALLEYAEQIVSLEAKAVDQANLAGTFSDRLIVGSVYAFYDCYMHENIERFVQRHNNISLRIVFGHSARIIAAVSQGSVDVGYSHHPFNHPGFNCTLVSEDEVILITGSQNREHTNGVSVEMVKDLPVYYSNFLYATTHNWLFPKHKLFQLDVDIGSKIVPFLQRGERYTFLPRKIVRREIAEGTVVEVPLLDGEIPPVQNYVIYKHEHPKSSSVQKWLDEFSLKGQG